MTPIIGTNVRVQLQATVGSPITATAVTLANPGVVTFTPNSPEIVTDGDIVVFSIDGGMVELDAQACRVSSAGGSTFTLEGLDTRSYSAFTTGTFLRVLTWETMDAAQNISLPNQEPAEIDVTTLLDKRRKIVYGLPGAIRGTISGLFNPTGAAEALLRTATVGNDETAFRVTFASGIIAVFNSFVSGGQGFDMATNAAATQTVALTPLGEVQYYAS